MQEPYINSSVKSIQFFLIVTGRLESSAKAAPKVMAQDLDI